MWHRLSVCLVSFAGCLGDDDDVVVFGDDGGNDDDGGGDDLCASSAECSLDVGTRFLKARSYCLRFSLSSSAFFCFILVASFLFTLFLFHFLLCHRCQLRQQQQQLKMKQ